MSHERNDKNVNAKGERLCLTSHRRTLLSGAMA